SDDLVRKLFAACRWECERELLLGLFESGARPCEIVGLEAGHFEQGKLWRVWGKGTKNKPTGERVLGLTPALVELTKKLAARHPDGPLFRNSRGGPWSEQTVINLLDRLRERLRGQGHEVPDLTIPYAFRHTRSSFLLGKLPPALVAKQMGNTPEV